MFKDYYSILGVPPSSSADVIRKAYKRMALLCHPDRTFVFSDTGGTTGDMEGLGMTGNSALRSTVHGSCGNATIPAFTELKEAYDVLSDVPRRYLYDLSYKQAAEQQQQQEMHRQRERERLQREREMRLQQAAQLEAQLAREREERERALAIEQELARREEQQQREKAGPSASLPPTADPTHAVEHEKIAATQEKRRERRPRAPRPVAAKASAAAPSPQLSAPPSRQGKLPPCHRRGTRASTVTFTVDMLDATQPRSHRPRGYPLATPEQMGLPSDYFATRAVDKAMRMFFSDVLPMLSASGDHWGVRSEAIHTRRAGVHMASRSRLRVAHYMSNYMRPKQTNNTRQFFFFVAEPLLHN
eukprot:gene6111-4393_t